MNGCVVRWDTYTVEKLGDRATNRKQPKVTFLARYDTGDFSIAFLESARGDFSWF